MREALVDHDSSLPAVAWAILSKTNSRQLCATLGADGLVAFDRLPESETVPEEIHRTLSGEPVPSLTGVPIDTLGCGDALLSVATLAFASGATHCEAVYLGSVAASIQAGVLGNRAVSKEALLDRLHLLSRPGVFLQRASGSIEERHVVHGARAR